MPTYDYKCLECNHTFEYFQKMTDQPLESCPKCKGKLKRLIGTGVRPIFKGSGFYETDYKNKSNSSKGKSTSVPSSLASDKKETAKPKENTQTKVK